MKLFTFFQKAKSQQGVTLIELLVVVAIIAVIAGVGFLAVSGSTNDADDSVRTQNAVNIRNAMEYARADNNGAYPIPSGLSATATAGQQCKELTGDVSSFFAGAGGDEMETYLNTFPSGPGTTKYYVAYETGTDPDAYRIVVALDGTVSGSLGNVAASGPAQDLTTGSDQCECSGQNYCTGSGPNV